MLARRPVAAHVAAVLLIRFQVSPLGRSAATGPHTSYTCWREEGGPATIRARASRRDTLPSLLVLSLDHSGRTVPKQQEFFFFWEGRLTEFFGLKSRVFGREIALFFPLVPRGASGKEQGVSG